MRYSIIFLVATLALWSNTAFGASDLTACEPSRSTWYEAVEHGNCGYGPLLGAQGPGHRFICAASTQLYNGSASCGECYEITGPYGTQTVVVVDQCPDPGWCDTSLKHLDLSPEAFAKVGQAGLGVVMTSIKKVSCDYVTGNIKVMMKDAATTSQWFEFMVWNHKVGIDHVDIETSDRQVISLKRQLYNYWTYSGNAKFPIIARIYSKYGERVDAYISSPAGAVTYISEGQFSDPASSIKATCSKQLAITPDGYIYNNGLTYPGNVKNPNLGWNDWSFSATLNWADTSVQGADSTSRMVASAVLGSQGAIQIGTDIPLSWAGQFTSVEFYIRADSPCTINVGFGSSLKATAASSSWTKYTYGLAEIGAPASISKPAHLDFRNPTTSQSPKIYLDKIRLV
eukprot:gene2649-3055_t